MFTTLSTPKSNRSFVRLLLALPLMFAATVCLAVPANADPAETYTSSTYNGMWHMGTVQYLTNDTQFNATIRLNDRTGDNFCTYLKVRAYVQTGESTVHTIGSVCGGRTANLYPKITANAGYRLTAAQVWTVRADGAMRSYIWEFYG